MAPGERVFVLGAWNEPKDTTGPKPWVDRDVMVINGKAWPHTERFTFDVGDTVRWRWVNPTVDAHPMHLHGFYYAVDSRGSWAADTVYRAPDRRRVVTEMLLPGGTMRMHWVAERPGNWLMHCHFAFHVSHFLSLDKIPDPVDPGAPDAVDHAKGGMAGLILGLTVRAPAVRTAAASAAAPPMRTATAPVVAARSLRLVSSAVRDTAGGQEPYAYAIQPARPEEAAAVPGGTLVLRRGEPVRLTLVNRLRAPTSVHWHGIEVADSYVDGVPGWSGTPSRLAPHIAPGDSFVVTFTPPRAGTFMYHAHSNEGHQISHGLYAPLLVLEPGAPHDPGRDLIFITGGDQGAGRVNRRREPAPVAMRVGVTYRLRLLNINPDRRMVFSLVSPSGLARWRALAKDGADLPPHQARVRPATWLTGPGETADFAYTPTTRGRLRLDLTAHTAPKWALSVPIHVR